MPKVAYFTDPSPTAELVRQIFGAVTQFGKGKTALVAKLRHAMLAIACAPRKGDVKAESRSPVETITAARRLARRSPKTNKRRSLRTISAELAAPGYLSPAGKPCLPGLVARMLHRAGSLPRSEPANNRNNQWAELFLRRPGGAARLVSRARAAP